MKNTKIIMRRARSLLRAKNGITGKNHTENFLSTVILLRAQLMVVLLMMICSRILLPTHSRLLSLLRMVYRLLDVRLRGRIRLMRELGSISVIRLKFLRNSQAGNSQNGIESQENEDEQNIKSYSKEKTLKVRHKSLIKPFRIISKLKSEINPIIKFKNSNDSKTESKSTNIVLLLNKLLSSLLDYKSKSQSKPQLTPITPPNCLSNPSKTHIPTLLHLLKMILLKIVQKIATTLTSKNLPK